MKLEFGRFFPQMYNTSVRDLGSLVRFNRENPDLAFSKGTNPYMVFKHRLIHSENHGQEFLERALEQDLSDETYRDLLNLTHAWGVEQGVDYALENCKVDALVLPAWTDMSIFAAWSRTSCLGTSAN